MTQNRHNCQKKKNNTSGYLGVHWSNGAKRWVAKVVANWKLAWSGNFENAEEAARARDRAARKYHGEFATLNFPEQP